MKRPKFLVIMTDQHRADHLGCYGNPHVRTPNIDGIARNGIRFEHFYVACPICMPNRIVFMTGRIPSVNGSRHNGIPLDRDAVTFVDLLRHAGYRTALIGKCHLQDMTDKRVPTEDPTIDEFDPPPPELREASRRRRIGPEYEAELIPLWRADPDRIMPLPYYGFDFVRLANGHGDQVHGHYTRWLGNRVADPEKLRGWQNALSAPGLRAPQAWRTAVPEELYPTTFVAEETVGYLERYAREKDSQPFFLHCSFPDPHHPFTPPGRYFDLYDATEVRLSSSFHAVDPHEPAFVRELRAATARGVSNTNSPVPFAITDEVAAKQIVALTYGMITMIDDAVGRVLQKLKELDLAKDTIVIFTSDHGDFMGDHGLMLKHGLHYEGVIRVPFIWSDPHERSHAVSPVLGGTIDIGTTILARAQLAPPRGNQGFDIIRATKNGEPPKRYGLVVEEDELAVHLGRSEGLRTRTFLTPRWRLTIWDSFEQGELFDRQADPDEVNNVWHSEKHQTQKHKLMEDMLREMIRLGDTAPFSVRVA